MRPLNSDPDVISVINQRFVPVRVDSDQRPDINSRYNMGGWPTAAFLTPYGDVIAGGTYMTPRQMQAALVQVADGYGRRKQDLVSKAQSVRERRAAPVEVSTVGRRLDGSIVDRVVKSVVEAYDPQYGGFGSQPKFPMVDTLELLLNIYRSTGNVEYKGMVENTLGRMMAGGMYDHQEEGVFRYSSTRDWSVPHLEKMLGDNVGLLRLYLRRYLATGNEEYGGVASRIAGYLNGRLHDAASGAFYGSQDANEEYYALPLAQRRQRSRRDAGDYISQAWPSLSRLYRPGTPAQADDPERLAGRRLLTGAERDAGEYRYVSCVSASTQEIIPTSDSHLPRSGGR